MLSEVVKVPYTTAPTMRKHEGALFNYITDTTLHCKKEEIAKFGKDLYGSVSELDNLIPRICQLLDLPKVTNILELALLVEEDIAIISNGKLDSICFCFPSNWVPTEKLGLNFNEIHQPIPENAKLLSAGDKIINAITNNGPFIRYVWTITNNPDLSNHPKNKINKEPKSINDLYFRYETQTTKPLPLLNASAFFVNVKVLPLHHFWENENYRTLIVNSINSMTDSILQYKNLASIKKFLNYAN